MGDVGAIPVQLDLSDAKDSIQAPLVEDSFLEDHHPIGFSPSTTDSLEFFIRGTEHWIDFSKSYVCLEGDIQGTSDKHVTDGDSTSPLKAGTTDPQFFVEQNFLHSIFSSVDVTVNDTAVSFNNANYPYIAYVQNICNLTRDQRSTSGSLCLWAETDDARKELIITPTKIAGLIQIKSPLLLHEKNLFSFVNVKVVMNRVTNPEFYFRWGGSIAGYKFQITKAVFKVRKLKVRDSYHQFWERHLDSGGFINYHLKDFRVFTRSYAGIPSEIIEDNLFHSILPTKVFFGFVDSDGFMGKKGQSPFNFQNVGGSIREVGLFVNGQLYPLPMLRGNFSTGETFEMYYHLLEALQGVHSPDPPMITKSDFDAGVTTLFGFNLSPDQYDSSDQRSLFNQPSNIRLHVKFSAGDAAKKLTLIVYYEMHASLSINKTRQIVFRTQ